MDDFSKIILFYFVISKFIIIFASKFVSEMENKHYCTGEQTKRALKLGAKLESGIAGRNTNIFDNTVRPYIYREPEPDAIAHNNSSCWFCPTTSEMIDWLRDIKGIYLDIHPLVGGEDHYWSFAMLFDFINDVEKWHNDPALAEIYVFDDYEQAAQLAINEALDYLEDLEKKGEEICKQ